MLAMDQIGLNTCINLKNSAKFIKLIMDAKKTTTIRNNKRVSAYKIIGTNPYKIKHYRESMLYKILRSIP